MFKMLVPVDGSENSSRAVAFLITKLPLYKEAVEIHLLNVQSPIASGNVRQFFNTKEIDEYYRDEGVVALKAARALLDAAGVSYSHHIGVGDVGETIAKYAREKQCQQIVMGTRGLGSVVGMLLGSVVTKVLHLTDVPVQLIK